MRRKTHKARRKTVQQLRQQIEYRQQRLYHGPASRKLINHLPIEMWQTALSYLAVQDILPHVPRCCKFLNEVVWGPWSAGLLWREIGGVVDLLFRSIKERAPKSHVLTLLAVVNVNVRDRHGYTPLYYACHDTEDLYMVQLVQLILSAGANPNLGGCYGSSHLYGCRNIEIARMLIDHGADVNKRSWTGVTPLMHLTWDTSDVPLTKLLLDARADVNLCDRYDTPLWRASIHRQYDIERLLIEAGANR